MVGRLALHAAADAESCLLGGALRSMVLVRLRGVGDREWLIFPQPVRERRFTNRGMSGNVQHKHAQGQIDMLTILLLHQFGFVRRGVAVSLMYSVSLNGPEETMAGYPI